MTKEYIIKWIKAAGVRALKTVAQTAISIIGVTAVVSEVDWVLVAESAALAGILSILTSIAGLPELKTGEVPEETEEEAGDE